RRELLDNSRLRPDAETAFAADLRPVLGGEDGAREQRDHDRHHQLPHTDSVSHENAAILSLARSPFINKAKDFVGASLSFACDHRCRRRRLSRRRHCEPIESGVPCLGRVSSCLPRSLFWCWTWDARTTPGRDASKEWRRTFPRRLGVFSLPS